MFVTFHRARALANRATRGWTVAMPVVIRLMVEFGPNSQTLFAERRYLALLEVADSGGTES